MQHSLQELIKKSVLLKDTLYSFNVCRRKICEIWSSEMGPRSRILGLIWLQGKRGTENFGNMALPGGNQL